MRRGSPRCGFLLFPASRIGIIGANTCHGCHSREREDLRMKRPYLAWYVLALVLALTPAGFRVLLWPGLKQQAADAAMVRAGETLFTHVWKEKDPLSPNGDGLGPVFN